MSAPDRARAQLARRLLFQSCAAMDGHPRRDRRADALLLVLSNHVERLRWCRLGQPGACLP